MTATARMEIDRDLTLLYRAEFQEQLSTTYEGQAHFVSTRPAGDAAAAPMGTTGRAEPSTVLAGNSSP
jgi:hypothetical protein